MRTKMEQNIKQREEKEHIIQVSTTLTTVPRRLNAVAEHSPTHSKLAHHQVKIQQQSDRFAEQFAVEKRVCTLHAINNTMFCSIGPFLPKSSRLCRAESNKPKYDNLLRI